MTETTLEAKPVRRIVWWQLLVWIAVLALLGVVAFRMKRSGPLAAGPVGAGEKAPDFTLTSFAGDTYQLSGLRGQVVVINFWASWCIPCEEEAAILENTWRHYQDQGVLLIGVDYLDTETAARAFMQRFNITYPNGPDLGTRISQAYRIRGVPETYVVDQTGTLVAVKIGPFRSEDELASIIDPLLEK